MKQLKFTPTLGITSKNFQMIISTCLPKGQEPPSEHILIDLGEGDQLSCQISTPVNWKTNGKTIVLIHGLGGSHSSRYMVRMARKLYARNDKVVRVNLRNCGSGVGLSKRPYCGGNSHDIQKVLEYLKKQSPDSDIQLIGYSLGGNIALKLAGELGQEADRLIKTVIAVCAPYNLEHAVESIQKKENRIYHSYFLKSILKGSHRWTSEKIHTIFEFDEKVTGPSWGYAGAKEYYHSCSCEHFLTNIRCETHLLFARDDPFVCIEKFKKVSFSEYVFPWFSDHGSHMGFLGSTKSEFQWMDSLLLNWTEGDFDSDCFEKNQ
ncbi:MAG: alpha/beta fold hydrolase [Parachlamydiaceae bacterium]|nr:alpha/beta fold hydrolase [Parachlamydiaceae bacterium]